MASPRNRVGSLFQLLQLQRSSETAQQRDVCWQLLSKLRSGMAVFEWKRLLFFGGATQSSASLQTSGDSGTFVTFYLTFQSSLGDLDLFAISGVSVLATDEPISAQAINIRSITLNGFLFISARDLLSLTIIDGAPTTADRRGETTAGGARFLFLPAACRCVIHKPRETPVPQQTNESVRHLVLSSAILRSHRRCAKHLVPGENTDSCSSLVISQAALGEALICDGRRVMTPAEDEVALQLSAVIIRHQNGTINKTWAVSTLFRLRVDTGAPRCCNRMAFPLLHFIIRRQERQCHIQCAIIEILGRLGSPDTPPADVKSIARP
ncbi:hypothetical protein F2P81_002650 [Scophthalmus maximus]|uniref:Uncharacterized protein n=1 Tax=Scophthalmus maximus TaxID=52904 RepID=A0A6A4TTV2_SCOMX|nr:hypothetical protein F2P81_002650 [Scophthalmus maximus]